MLIGLKYDIKQGSDEIKEPSEQEIRVILSLDSLLWLSYWILLKILMKDPTLESIILCNDSQMMHQQQLRHLLTKPIDNLNLNPETWPSSGRIHFMGE